MRESDGAAEPWLSLLIQGHHDHPYRISYLWMLNASVPAQVAALMCMTMHRFTRLKASYQQGHLHKQQAKAEGPAEDEQAVDELEPLVKVLACS